MTKTTRYQVKDTLSKRGKHRTLLGVDPLTGLPVLIYVFPDRPRVTVGRLESDTIPSILAARYNSEKTMGQVVVAHSEERQAVSSVATKEDALRLLLDTAKALAAATHAKVIHGDISPSRFMVEGGHYLLEGYGVNWPAQDARFAPPEGGVSLKGDIFSWGQSVYDLAGHILPRALTKLVATCLADDPDKRPDAPTLLTELELVMGDESPSSKASDSTPVSTSSQAADEEFSWPGDDTSSPSSFEDVDAAGVSTPDTAGSFGDLDFELDFKDNDTETFKTTAHAGIESGERLADFELEGFSDVPSQPPSFLDDETAADNPLAQQALEVTPIPESRADARDVDFPVGVSSTAADTAADTSSADDINFMDTPPQPSSPAASGAAGASGLSDLSDILPSSSSASASSSQPSTEDTPTSVLTAPTTDGDGGFVKGLPTGAKVRTVESKKKSSPQDAAASQKFPKTYSPVKKQKPQRSWRPVWLTLLFVAIGVIILIAVNGLCFFRGDCPDRDVELPLPQFYPLNVNIRPNRISQAQLVVVVSPEGSVHEPGDEVATVPARVFLDREGVWQVRARFRNALSEVQTITVPQTGAITLEIPLPEDDPELQ
ncbi:MAG: hypothetical protein AAF708_03640 [Deinococcota bacterium]